MLATAGDSFLGGDDVDRAIVEQLVREMRGKGGLDVSTDAGALVRLRAAAQRAKHRLSDSICRLISGVRPSNNASGKPCERSPLAQRQVIPRSPDASVHQNQSER